MNYGSLATTIEPRLKRAVKTILNPEISPEIRRFNLEILLRETGTEVYEDIYAMNAYDMEIEYTTGDGMGDRYYGMAKNLSDSISLGGSDQAEAELELWLQDVIHKAQFDAFSRAADSGKYRVATRTELPSCCDWCRRHVGTFVEPTPEVFAQHEHCKGEITTSGWKTHNGTLLSADEAGRGWKKLKE